MAFNDFVQTELPLRPFTAADGQAGQVPVRSNNAQAARELIWVDPSSIGGANILMINRANEDVSNLAKGTPVFSYSETGVRKAVANSTGEAWKVIGLAIAPVLQGSIGKFQAEGVLSATLAEWDALTGDLNGLVQGKTYFLHPSNVGKITLIPPTGESEYLCRIGVAHSPTELYVDLGLCIKL